MMSKVKVGFGTNP